MDNASGLYAGVLLSDAGGSGELAFSNLQKAMLDATPDCIKLLSPDGRLLSMNRAGCVALNVSEESGFGMPWLPLLAPDNHVAGDAALKCAAHGEVARFSGKSMGPRDVAHWDNLLTPIVDNAGRVRAVLCVSRDITEKVLLEAQLEASIERERLLGGEIQHRIKNLFSVVMALIAISEREAGAASATAILRDKLAALTRASEAAFLSNRPGEQTLTMDMAELVQSVLQPYGRRCRVRGEPLVLRNEAIMTLALYLHELATNSLKYGALREDAGEILVQWRVDTDRITLSWREDGGPLITTAPKRRGFGSDMVDRLVRAAGGQIDRKWHVEGLIVDLFLPQTAFES